MKRRNVVGLLVSCAILAASLAMFPRSHIRAAKPDTAGAAAVSATASADAWPIFRGNAMSTGVAAGRLPAKLELLWKAAPSADSSFESTAAIVDGVVYVGNLDGNLYAYDLANAKEKWKFHTEAGFKSSPAVRNGLLFAGDLDGVFYCLDAASGEKKWSYETNAEIDGSANFHGEHVLIGSQNATLYCFQAATGQEVWKFTIGDQIRCSPTVAGDRCFVAGCDGKLHVVDLNAGKETGSVPIQSPTGCTPAAAGERIYFGTEGESFFCVDWKAPKSVWEYRNEAQSSSIRSSAALTDKLVIFCGRNKLVQALDPVDGREVWSFPTKKAIDSSPVVLGDRVFVATGDGRLDALALETGKLLWSYEAGGSFIASPAIAAGRLVLGNTDGVLYCFGAKP